MIILHLSLSLSLSLSLLFVGVVTLFNDYFYCMQNDVMAQQLGLTSDPLKPNFKILHVLFHSNFSNLIMLFILTIKGLGLFLFYDMLQILKQFLEYLHQDKLTFHISNANLWVSTACPIVQFGSLTRERIIVPLAGHLKFTYPGRQGRRG